MWITDLDGRGISHDPPWIKDLHTHTNTISWGGVPGHFYILYVRAYVRFAAATAAHTRTHTHARNAFSTGVLDNYDYGKVK